MAGVDWTQTVIDHDGSAGVNLARLVPQGSAPHGVVKEKLSLHEPVMNLADYVDEGAAPPPAAVWRPFYGFNFGALLNTRIGDCGEAMAIHGIEIEHLDGGTPVPPFGDGDAENLYSRVGGYVPGDPSTDNGTDNTVLFDVWQSEGVRCLADSSVHKIEGTAEVDPKDVELGHRAIYEFRVLYRAIALPVTAQRQNHWRLTDPSLQGDAAPGSWGYHDIPLYCYDSAQWLAVSWGVPIVEGEGFDDAYAIQGLVTITEEMLNRKGVGPGGINYDKMRQDFTRFQG